MRRHILFLALLVLAGGCKESTSNPTPPPPPPGPPPPPPPPAAPASVTLTPATSTVLVGANTKLTATVRDAGGNTLNINVTTWSTNNENVATVNSTGVVTGVAVGGPVTITGYAGSVSGSAQVTVEAVPVAIVEMTPATASVVVNGTTQLTATLKSANGTVLTGRSVTWSSGNEAAATVSNTGLVTAVAVGNATITATSEGKSATSSITVNPPPVSVQSIVTGGYHSCAMMTNGTAKCWGVNAEGRIGDGSTTNRLQPVAVTQPQPFKAIFAGFLSTCAIGINDVSYCWGSGNFGNLGNGTTAHKTIPTAVVAAPPGVRNGGFASLADVTIFKQIAPSPLAQTTCALSTGSITYCWGRDPTGLLTGSESVLYPTLLPVGSTPPLVELNVGELFGCGRTATNEAWCWGFNAQGQLGDGTTSLKVAPVKVSGGHAFTMIRSGYGHSCGIRTDKTLWCWGANDEGQLGDGSTTSRTTPVQVGSANDYIYVAAGIESTCAIRTGGTTWCWGYNFGGQLGDGTKISRSSPVAVGGGKLFSQIASGAFHTCALATDGVYCWGGNGGQVGDGTTTDRLTPTKVVGL